MSTHPNVGVLAPADLAPYSGLSAVHWHYSSIYMEPGRMHVHPNWTRFPAEQTYLASNSKHLFVGSATGFWELMFGIAPGQRVLDEHLGDTAWWNQNTKDVVAYFVHHAKQYIENVPLFTNTLVYEAHYPMATTSKSARANLPVWELIEAVLGKTRRVLFYGPPGTGKTFAAARLALLPKQESKLITVTEESPMSEIRGHYSIVGGSMKWQDGVGISAWRNGDRLVINEINRASGDIQTFLYALLDDPEFAAFTLPTGETVRPDKNFSVVATMNGVPEDLPEALQDRFPVAININEVNPAAIAATPEWVRGHVAETCKPSLNEKYVSMRTWDAFVKLVDAGVAVRVAAQAVFTKAIRADIVDSIEVALAAAKVK